jgi:aspartate/methionine/tyrosine aminotransferase
VQTLQQQSRRLASVQAPVIPIVGRWTAETPGTISLGQGVVSYEPPHQAMDAARRFGNVLADHRYGPVEGFPILVEALERKLAAENRIQVQPKSRVLVTAGGNQAFMNAVLAITDPDDEVILPAPYYFNHEMAVVIAGAKAIAVPTRDDYQLDLNKIERAITPRTRAVVTVSPNNPTGAVYPETDLRAVNALCKSKGLFHVHDEAYEYFMYGDARNFSPGSIPDASGHTISLYSFSKAYGMASWRVGYMVIPEALNDAINKIQDTILICPPAASQYAAAAAGTAGCHAASDLRVTWETRCALRRALARWRLLLPRPRTFDARLDDPDRTLDQGTSRSHDSRLRIRRPVAVLDPDLVRRARPRLDYRRPPSIG